VDKPDGLLALTQRVRAVLAEKGAMLATAESCTGGLVGHVLTEVPGISQHYLGGLISYSDALKRDELGVPSETLEQHGAVSAETCLAMADGARRRYRADLALAITGIAGPDGGTADKPVGLTFVAVADAQRSVVRQHVWHGDRQANKVASAKAGLGLLLEHLGDR
jgi:PncC family amidohydrolase